MTLPTDAEIVQKIQWVFNNNKLGQTSNRREHFKSDKGYLCKSVKHYC